MTAPDPDISIEHFEHYIGDGIATIRSRTNLLWCANDEIHEHVDDDTDIPARLAALDVEHAEGAPHRVEAMPYPFPSAGVSIDTHEGRFALGTAIDNVTELEEHLRASQPVPWALVLPDGTAIITTVEPRLIQALFVAFTGQKTYGDMTATVDDAYAQIAAHRAGNTLDPGDQQL